VTNETPPIPKLEESEPATIADVRGQRRWLVVAAVWAMAATAIAVIALVAASDNSDEQLAAATGQIGRVQRQLSGRIDELESRVEKLPQSEDISRLENRLEEVENSAGKSSDRLKALSGMIDRLDRQVERLETRDTGTQTTETTTTP
jgi:septal ring factor EnvC (AmiA/AmiB activator)